MKRLFALLFILFINCESSTEVKEIEILTYFSDARDFVIYSNIGKNGFTQNLSRSERSEYIDIYQTRISEKLMDSVVEICKNKTNEDFVFKISKKSLYCGYWHSIQITFKDGEKLNFRYPYANNKNKQFIPFELLLKQIQKDSLHATRLNIGQLGSLYIKQKDLSNYTFKKDSIIIDKILKE